MWRACWSFRASCLGRLALTLFVAGVLADDHDPPVTADHLALVADLLDAGLDLHRLSPGMVLMLARGGSRDAASQVDGRLLVGLLVAVDDAAAIEVIGAELHHHAVLGEDPDVVLTHLAADVSENLVPVGQLNAKESVGQCFDHGALDLYDPVFLGHVLRNPLTMVPYCRACSVLHATLRRRRLSVTDGPLVTPVTRTCPSRGACVTSGS